MHTITTRVGPAGTTNPKAVAGYATDRETRNIIHDLLDGSVGVSYIEPRPRSGTLVTVYDNRAEAWAAYALLGSASKFAYTCDDINEISMSFVLDGRLNISQDEDDTGIWYVEIDYQEVPA